MFPFILGTPTIWNYNPIVGKYPILDATIVLR